MSAKTRRRFSQQESKIMQRVHRENDGRWAAIMADPVIKAMDIDSHQIQNHLRNLVKGARKKVREAGGWDAVTEKRVKRERAPVDYESDESSDDSERDSNDTTSSEADAPRAKKRRDPSELARAVSAKKPRTQDGTGAKSLASATLAAREAFGIPEQTRVEPAVVDEAPRDANEALFATSVASLDVQSMDDMLRVAQDARTQGRKEAAVKREKRDGEPRVRETLGLVDSLQQHQSVMESQGAMQSTMQMMALKMMKRMAHDIEEEQGDGEETSNLRQSVSALRQDIQALREEVAGMRRQMSAQPGVLIEPPV